MKTIKKWFWVWQQDEEKKYLEQQALAGLRLSKIGFNKYFFSEAAPEELVYEMDFRGLNNKIKEDEYLQLYEDAGWQLAAKYGSWYYFYQEKANNTQSSIFNDNKSKGAVYKRLLVFLLIIGFPLYYQTIFLFPNLPLAETTYPNFYFFFRIVVSIFVILHLFALIRIFLLYKKTKENIKE
jgi:hypothetical protein